MTPAYRVGKTANLLIFLGILYSVLHLVAWLGNTALRARGYGGLGWGVSLGIIGLGYGIRYGRVFCLYTATGVFAWFTALSGYRVLSQPELYQGVRFLLSAWAWFHLYRAIPALRVLRQTHALPLRPSRYGAFFLRHWLKS